MRRKLLLADDSVTIQRVIELTFADEPVDVATVGDGAAAIARLDAEPPDVVLADIGMPGQSGYDVAMHVRRTPALAHIPVILLTGAFDPVDHARARAAGCTGVLVKPFDPQMLIARVRQLLDTPRPVHAAADDERLAARADQVAPEPQLDDAPVTQQSTGATVPAGQHGGHDADVQLRADEQAEQQSPSVTAGPRLRQQSEGREGDTRSSEVDEYFDRLDRAFAVLQSAGPAAPPVSSLATGDSEKAAGVSVAAPPPAATPSPPSPPPAVGPVAAASVSSSGPAATATLGDAFAALLAIEQGQPVPVGNAWASILNEDLVPRIAARVSREISERVIRELAPDIVSRVAERMVREEIERLKIDRVPQ